MCSFKMYQGRYSLVKRKTIDKRLFDACYGSNLINPVIFPHAPFLCQGLCRDFVCDKIFCEVNF